MTTGERQNVLFRCDATKQGGIGHIVRCSSLAHFARAAGWGVHLSGTVTDQLALEIVAEHHLAVHPGTSSMDELSELALELSASVIHIDHYEPIAGFGAKAGQMITSTATDGGFGRRPADVVVDGSPIALARHDPNYDHADVALGPRYLALRANLQGVSGFNHPSAAEPRVLVMMGGTDAAGYGPAVATALSRLPSASEIGLVGFRPTPAGVVAVDRTPNLPSMVDGWDVVVTAAGTTVWELASMGVPMGVIGVVENQRDHYEWLTSTGIAVGLGFIPGPSATDIPVEQLDEFLRDPAARHLAASRGQLEVDGRGAERVVDIWAAALADRSTTTLAIRSAAMRDAGRLFAWRNDTDARTSSRNSAPLVWPNHIEWLSRSLSSDDRLLYVGVAEGEPVGTVRFDEVTSTEWEVSIAIAPLARGRGHATGLVALGIEQLRDSRCGVQTVRAVLQTTNRASAALFSRLGFERTHSHDGWETWVLGL